jgi:hypothetical protein
MFRNFTRPVYHVPQNNCEFFVLIIILFVNLHITVKLPKMSKPLCNSKIGPNRHKECRLA